MKKLGFTLIEVLIAMMIIAIAFTAILKATNTNTLQTERVENKMTAHWVAMEILTAAQVGTLPLPPQNRPLEGKTKMLGRIYHWEVKSQETNDKLIKQLNITVKYQGQELASLATSALLDQETENA